MVLTRRTPRAVVTAAVVLACLLAWSSGFSAQAPRGAVRGRVEIRNLISPSAPAPQSSGGGHANGSHEMAPPYRQAVVYFESAPENLEVPTGLRVQMHQRNQTFIPHLLAITTGTTVDFPNDDTIYHNVFSLSKTRRFDLGRYAAGRSKSVRFDQPGIVRVFCDIHSQMNAFIFVFPHRFFAVTDEEGRFRFDRIPPGRYRLTAWYEGVSRKTLEVTVSPGATSDLVFVLE